MNRQQATGNREEGRRKREEGKKKEEITYRNCLSQTRDK
jgi:hypothetical protein